MPDWAIALTIIGFAMMSAGALLAFVHWVFGVEDRLRALESRFPPRVEPPDSGVTWTYVGGSGGSSGTRQS